MIGVIITFRSEGGLDRSTVLGVAEKAAPSFEGMPGLRSKVFTFDGESGEATNVYVWESEDAARAFFTRRPSAEIDGL